MTAPAPSSGRALAGGRKHMRRGITWTAVGMAASKCVSIIAKLVLARLLVPEYFGFVSMVLVFTEIVKIGAELGLRNTLINRRRDSSRRLRYDSAFWLLVMVACAAIAAMWLFGAPLLVWFYDEPELRSVAIAMSFGILLENLRVVPEARLARGMRFKQITLCEMLGTFLGCATAVALAAYGAGVWSLVAQTLAATAGTTALLFFSAGWLPRFHFSSTCLNDIKEYSSYILGSRMLIYLQQNLDYVLIGKMLGAHSVGIYAIAFMVTETLRAQLYWIVGRVVFPIYSRLGGDAPDTRNIYLGTIRYMTAITFPIAILFVLFSEDMVRTLFTDAWMAAVLPVKILALASMVTASAGTPSEVLRGVGKPDVDFGVNLKVTVLVALPALAVGIHWLGLPGAALAVLFHYLVSRLLFHHAIRREIAVTTLDVLAAMRPACMGGLMMLLCSLLLRNLTWAAEAAASGAAYLLIAIASAGPRSGRSDGARDNRGAVVVILGPDGAGKTTLAQNLERLVPGGGRRLYLGMGLGEKWAIAPVRALYSYHLKQQDRWIHKVTGALIWYFFLPLELIARRLISAFEGPGRIVLIDRLPGRPFQRGGVLLHCYRLFLPRVDSTILLVGDPTEIAGRKPDETTVSLTIREMAKWEMVAARTGARGVIRLDTTRYDVQACTRLLMEQFAPTVVQPRVVAP